MKYCHLPQVLVLLLLGFKRGSGGLLRVVACAYLAVPYRSRTNRRRNTFYALFSLPFSAGGEAGPADSASGDNRRGGSRLS